jgi:hypothetical protein
MKRFITIASLALALSVGAGVAEAGKNNPNKPAKGDRAAKRDADAVIGKVQKVEGDKLITSAGRGKKAAEVTVTTDADTKVKVNGQDGKLDQIKPGMRVVAKPNTGTAKTIVARDAGERKNGKGATPEKTGAK